MKAALSDFFGFDMFVKPSDQVPCSYVLDSRMNLRMFNRAVQLIGGDPTLSGARSESGNERMA